MTKLISDSAKLEISARVKDVLRAFIIDDWQSETYYQHQNFAERGYKDTKSYVNLIPISLVLMMMNDSGSAVCVTLVITLL
jgi:hypothetical protein